MKIKTKQFPQPKDLINDQWLLVFAYPIFSFLAVHIGNDNGFFKLLKMKTYYTDLLFALICVYGCGFLVKKVAHTLNNKIGWDRNQIKAIKYQFIFGLLVPALAVVLAEIIYLRIIGVSLETSSLFYLEFPLAILLLSLINIIYIFMYTQSFFSKALEKKKLSEKEHITVKEGKSLIILSLKEVAFFIKRDSFVFLVTKTGKEYAYDMPFKNILEKLPPDLFFQLNRQIISSKSSIIKSTKTETRRLKIDLSPSPSNEVYVAKVNATKFQKWLDSN